MNEGLVIFVRTIIAFFSLLIFTRFLGKKQLSQITLFEYILGIAIGGMPVSISIDLSAKAWPFWIGLLTWTGAGLSIDLLTTKSRYAAKLIEGEPSIIVMNGKILEDNMRKLRYNAANLQQQLRCRGIFDLNEVHFAVLEPNGELSVLKKSELQPLTLKDIDITVPDTGIGIELIYDGIVIDLNLKQINHDRKWLNSKLRKQGVNHPSEVFLATYEASGSLIIDKYKDYIQKSIDIGDFKGPY